MGPIGHDIYSVNQKKHNASLTVTPTYCTHLLANITGTNEGIITTQ